MPIYVYECSSCEKTFEVWLSLAKAKKAQRCPDCDKKMKKLPSSCSFHLKGTGWYVTDYKNPKKKD